ncbi:hypothetical protein HY464_02985 [Candidatus Peregrinibacteria bacterium]|nr:hypothetical protein [Candidatus Peregrinibacteria bacterium]
MIHAVVGCTIFILAVLPLSADTPSKKADIKPMGVHITRTTDGDVTIVAQGAKYYAWDFDIFPANEKGQWHVVVTFIEFDHSTHLGGRIGYARDITVKNVLCDVSERQAKRLRREPNITYVLVKGPEAEPGKDLYLEGIFTWSRTDGESHFFHEKGTERVWKSVPPKEEKKKYR